MKPREPRRKVLIGARMRCGASWSDACILNLSTRGMLLQAPQAPSRGSYLEIRRGAHVIVARVVWACSDRFGIQSQDKIPAEELINDPDRTVTDAAFADGNCTERRTTALKASSRHEASRWRARAMEFATLTLLGTVAASFALGAVSSSLARPLAMVELALIR